MVPRMSIRNSLFFAVALFSQAAHASPRLDAVVLPLIQAVQNTHLHRYTCVSATDALLAKLYTISPDRFKLKDYVGAKSYLGKPIYLARLHLREELAALYQQGNATPQCARGVQRVLRFYRGLEDYLGYNSEIAGLNETSFSDASTLYGTAAFPASQTYVNPKYKDEVEVRSGDLLLSRGDAATSSAIARLANDATQFSHLALVYVDPNVNSKTGKHDEWLIEAHIEFGVKISPLSTWLKDNKKRTVLFRNPDRALAARSAALMYEKVRTYDRDHNGEHIPYDFGFDMNDHERIFCSEVTRVAYELGSNHTYEVPLFPARLTPKNRGFLDMLGIHQVISFLPADMEIDVRFYPVLEWRNFSGLEESWTRDAITTKINEWMDRDSVNYDLNWVYTDLGKLLKYAREHGIAKNKLSKDADTRIIALMERIEIFYKKVQKRLAEKEQSVLARRGTPFTIFELYDEIEKLRGDPIVTKVLH